MGCTGGNSTETKDFNKDRKLVKEEINIENDKQAKEIKIEEKNKNDEDLKKEEEEKSG